MPGGVKRNQEEIKDDRNFFDIKTEPSYTVKVMKDFTSRISCLPGERVDRARESFRPQKSINSYKYRDNDIFNRHADNRIFDVNFVLKKTNRMNTFNENRRIFTKDNRVFGQSHNEKPLIPHPKSSRPVGIRNVFESHFTIN